jgi:hypothetical protein
LECSILLVGIQKIEKLKIELLNIIIKMPCSPPTGGVGGAFIEE